MSFGSQQPVILQKDNSFCEYSTDCIVGDGSCDDDYEDLCSEDEIYND